ncbi:MAG: preprotein translocase subunit SecE [Glaciecola sp.]|jgi:preprotein translocase subunit SecE
MNRDERRAAKRDEKNQAQQPVIRDSSSSELGPRKRTGPVQFLKEVRTELRKVAWPTRREVGSYTVVVLSVTTALTSIVFAMDWVIRNATLNLFG